MEGSIWAAIIGLLRGVVGFFGKRYFDRKDKAESDEDDRWLKLPDPPLPLPGPVDVVKKAHREIKTLPQELCKLLGQLSDSTPFLRRTAEGEFLGVNIYLTGKMLSLEPQGMGMVKVTVMRRIGARESVSCNASLRIDEYPALKFVHAGQPMRIEGVIRYVKGNFVIVEDEGALLQILDEPGPEEAELRRYPELKPLDTHRPKPEQSLLSPPPETKWRPLALRDVIDVLKVRDGDRERRLIAGRLLDMKGNVSEIVDVSDNDVGVTVEADEGADAGQARFRVMTLLSRKFYPGLTQHVIGKRARLRGVLRGGSRNHVHLETSKLELLD